MFLVKLEKQKVDVRQKYVFMKIRKTLLKFQFDIYENTNK